MDLSECRRRFKPAVEEIVGICTVADEFVDKDKFRVYIATIWGNAALEPGKSGIEETELPTLHDFLNEEIEQILGRGETISSCYEYIVSKKGDESLERLQIGSQHKEFLHYFARIILGGELPQT